MMSRRVTSWWRSRVLVIGLAVMLGAQSQTADAQQATKPPRIGILSAGPLPPRKHQWEAFRQGLRELGYVEGENIVLEFRAPQEEGGRHEDLAADLARLKVNVIVAATTPAIQAAMGATSTIPIVMATSNDPVEAGLVASLARPGGNVTGLSTLAVELSAKRLQLLREIVPGVSRVAVLWNPDTPGTPAMLRQTEDAARALGIQLLKLEVRRADDIEKAFGAAVKSRAGALFTLEDRLFYGLRARVADLALKHRLPAISGLRPFAEAGGLAVYGPSDTENYRRAATYVDKILKGAKPADLPVEQPTQFELIINTKTAKAIGLTIPQSVLLRADRIIQ
jgi:putative ABC transport system substrate-binding protein